MFELLNPFLLGGLAAISAPVIIHLLHRRHARRVDWGAMRFLLELLAKRRKRLFFEDLLLLVLRALIIGCIALLMVRPALLKNAGAGAEITRVGRTAAVLLIDDSVSSSAGRAQPAFELMKKLALAYVESLAPGDEVSVLLMSRAGEPAGDPVFDLESVKAQLGALKPSYVTTDIPALLDAGLGQLKQHVNPGAELVLLTDGRKDGWHGEDRSRWDDLRARLAGQKNSPPGTRDHPRVLVLSPEITRAEENLALTRISMDRTLVAAATPARIRVTVNHYGKEPRRAATVQASVNGQVIGSSQVDVPGNGQAEAVFAHTFETPGSYAIEAALVDNQDLLPADDHRAMSLQVESSVPVLLVDTEAAAGLQGKLGFLSCALDPDGEGRSSFKVRRITGAQLSTRELEDCRVVVLGDTRVLESSVVDALERFVVAGGGILVGLGPTTDPETVNHYWARDGEGFLPCPLGALNSPAKPPIPATINVGHRVFSGFGAKNDEAWKNARIRSYYRLAPGSTPRTKPEGGASRASADVLEPLLTLDNGDPLVVERRRGLGLACVVATSLNADWSDLPLQAAYVPLMRGLVGDLGSFVMPPRNLQPGEQLIYAQLKGTATNVTASGPQGPLKLSIGGWEGRDAVLSEGLMQPGIYELRAPNEPGPLRYAVALDPAESALQPVPRDDITRALGKSTSLLNDVEQVAQQLQPTRRRSAELWKWFLAAALGLMFLESWLPGRAVK